MNGSPTSSSTKPRSVLKSQEWDWDEEPTSRRTHQFFEALDLGINPRNQAVHLIKAASLEQLVGLMGVYYID